MSDCVRSSVEGHDWKQEFLDNGYFIFRGLLDENELAVIRERVRFIAEHAESYEKLGIGNLKEVGQETSPHKDPLHRFYRLNAAAYHNETIWKTMIANPRTIALVRSVMEDDFCVNAGGFFLKPPGHGSAVPWHQDTGAWNMPPAPFDPDEPFIFDYWLAIDRATKENGCLQLLPKSHKLGRLAHVKKGDYLSEVDPEAHGYDIVKDSAICEMNGGDIVVWHQNALHYSGPNRSDQQRIGHAGTFMALGDVPWMREIKPNHKMLDHLPVCHEGEPLDLPEKFKIDEEKVLAMSN